jgi:hypothetical protein
VQDKQPSLNALYPWGLPLCHFQQVAVDATLTAAIRRPDLSVWAA